jgi:Ca2+-binding EF-hand superfamily protein
MTDEERAAALKQRAEMMRKRLDTDGDGKLTPAELTAARGRMRFDDPAAIDTNHDGDISTDELVAAMKARADQRRAQRAGSGNADGAGDGSGDGDGSGGAGGW